MRENIPFIPERDVKPREKGLTMMMDKGLSLREAENFVASSAEFTDVVKFGFGTALITHELEEKNHVYKEGNLITYFGGTLFELYVIRGLFDDYRRLLDKYGMEMAEVSDGSMILPHNEKLQYIEKLSEQVTVLSEVGSKQADVVFPPNVWVAMMKAELEAGSWKVIAEARESGTTGIYNPDGSANTTLIDDIIKQVQIENVIWDSTTNTTSIIIRNSGTRTRTIIDLYVRRPSDIYTPITPFFTNLGTGKLLSVDQTFTIILRWPNTLDSSWASNQTYCFMIKPKTGISRVFNSSTPA